VQSVVIEGDIGEIGRNGSLQGPSWRGAERVLGGELCDAVDEMHSFDELTEFFDAGDAVPAPLSLESELQHHRKCALAAEGAPDAFGAVTQCRKS
jgi:hypothetical protein